MLPDSNVQAGDEDPNTQVPPSPAGPVPPHLRRGPEATPGCSASLLSAPIPPPSPLRGWGGPPGEDPSGLWPHSTTPAPSSGQPGTAGSSPWGWRGGRAPAQPPQEQPFDGGESQTRSPNSCKGDVKHSPRQTPGSRASGGERPAAGEALSSQP